MESRNVDGISKLHFCNGTTPFSCSKQASVKEGWPTLTMDPLVHAPRDAPEPSPAPVCVPICRFYSWESLVSGFRPSPIATREQTHVSTVIETESEWGVRRQGLTWNLLCARHGVTNPTDPEFPLQTPRASPKPRPLRSLLSHQ
ncbi:hypothetical protein RvY_01433 [Ramazzottius varieornatus]|uniref:Uncharacterized protein n=1 Tax=Ramazzottius varieornatus TaxID=947166 RepID=A0A1D1UGA4_RAMVA|nr:hypothetical protein RvY_01433 [Ramazzottius varieornatus]